MVVFDFVLVSVFVPLVVLLVVAVSVVSEADVPVEVVAVLEVDSAVEVADPSVEVDSKAWSAWVWENEIQNAHLRACPRLHHGRKLLHRTPMAKPR